MAADDDGHRIELEELHPTHRSTKVAAVHPAARRSVGESLGAERQPASAGKRHCSHRRTSVGELWATLATYTRPILVIDYGPSGAIHRIPLPDPLPGGLLATGFSVVGPDPAAALSSCGADVLVCLLTDEEIDRRFPPFAEWLAEDPRAERLAIEDGGVTDPATMAAFVRRMNDRVSAGDLLLSHCGAGIGRTSLLAVGMLLALATPLDHALATVRRARPGAGPENPEQAAFLVDLAASLA